MNQILKLYVCAGDVAQLPSMDGALVQLLATCKLGTVALACVDLKLLWLKWVSIKYCLSRYFALHLSAED